MNINLGRSWTKTLKSRVERYEFEVGVLDDKPHREPTAQIGNYAGGPVRSASRKHSTQSVADVLIANMERLNINILLRPFQEKSSDIIRFTNEFLKMVVAKSNIKRVENLLQAIVRNPILRKEYGDNNAATADAKGFDRHLIDTAQMFKNLRARAKRV